MFTTYEGVLGAMPGLTGWDVAWLQRGWSRVTANGLTAWRFGFNSYYVERVRTS